MKLALTLEADSINVQALNMGRIVVDVDGVTLAELINVACDNGYSLRVVDESDRTSAERTPPSAALTGIRCSTAHIRKILFVKPLLIQSVFYAAGVIGFG